MVYKLPEHLLLFSACIGVYDDGLTIALGTIFSGVLLVRIKDARLFVYKHLQGHKGSVYGIAMNNDTVASVSDDRNLLVYKNCAKKVIKCTGHDARVWKVALHSNSFILSIGEDSRCCVWDGNTGELISSLKHSSGKVGLTSLAVDSLAIIAGSFDGSIVRWPVSEIGKTPNVSVYSTDQVAKNFCVLNGKVIIITNDGIVYWNGIRCTRDEELASYTVLHPHTATNTLLVGTKHGKIYFITEQKAQCIAELSEKVNAIFVEGNYMCIQAEKHAIVMARDVNKVVWRVEAVVTAFALIDGLFIVGDRNGRVFSQGKPGIELNQRNDAITCIEAAKNYIRVIDRSSLTTHLSREDHSIMSQTRLLTDVTIERSHGDLLYGFQLKHFFVYSISEHQKLYQVFCAGQHRRWQLCLESNLFAFLREGKIHLAPIELINKDVLRRGMHQREIRDALVLDETFIVTVGEDNNVFIIDTLYSKLYKQPTVHTSGIKCITGCREQVITAGGGNEVWVWSFKVDDGGVPCLTPIKHLETLNESDCRVLSVDTNYPEELIVTGSSDGQILTFSQARNTCMRTATSHGDNCVQHVRIVSNDALISAGSDGCLIYCKDPSSPAVLKIHQSGINCLCIVEEHGSQFIVTGGDDQAICICRIEHNSLVLLKQVQAHSAAVNGIAAFFKGRSLCILSVGLDRFISLHTYDHLEPQSELVPVGRFKVDVADASVLRLLSHDSKSARVFVGGIGYGIYSIPIHT